MVGAGAGLDHQQPVAGHGISEAAGRDDLQVGQPRGALGQRQMIRSAGRTDVQLDLPAPARQVVGGERSAGLVVGPVGRCEGNAAGRLKRIDGAEIVSRRGMRGVGQDVPSARRIDDEIRSVHLAVEHCTVGKVQGRIAGAGDAGRMIGPPQARAMKDQHALVNTRITGIRELRRRQGNARSGIVALDDPCSGPGLGEAAGAADRSVHHGHGAAGSVDRAITAQLKIALRRDAGVQLQSAALEDEAARRVSQRAVVRDRKPSPGKRPRRKRQCGRTRQRPRAVRRFLECVEAQILTLRAGADLAHVKRLRRAAIQDQRVCAA